LKSAIAFALCQKFSQRSDSFADISAGAVSTPAFIFTRPWFNAKSVTLTHWAGVVIFALAGVKLV
jgi:hypothetical protein